MRLLRYLLGVLFIVAGANHFVSPDFYLEMMPEWLPLHGPAVFWSGVAEVAGGVLLLFERTARAGGVLLILLLIAIFPANVNAAINPESVPWVERNGISDLMLWLRLPLQPLLGLLIWIAVRRSGGSTLQGDPKTPLSTS